MSTEELQSLSLYLDEVLEFYPNRQIRYPGLGDTTDDGYTQPGDYFSLSKFEGYPGYNQGTASIGDFVERDYNEPNNEPYDDDIYYNTEMFRGVISAADVRRLPGVTIPRLAPGDPTYDEFYLPDELPGEFITNTSGLDEPRNYHSYVIPPTNVLYPPVKFNKPVSSTPNLPSILRSPDKVSQIQKKVSFSPLSRERRYVNSAGG